LKGVELDDVVVLFGIKRLELIHDELELRGHNLSFFSETAERREKSTRCNPLCVYCGTRFHGDGEFQPFAANPAQSLFIGRSSSRVVRMRSEISLTSGRNTSAPKTATQQHGEKKDFGGFIAGYPLVAVQIQTDPSAAFVGG